MSKRSLSLLTASILVLVASVAVPPSREWLNRNAGAANIIVGAALVLVAAVTAWLARGAVQQRVSELEGEHVAAVSAVFHELRAVAVPLRYALEHGDLISVRAMESYGDVYRGLLVPFYRGLPQPIATRAATTYGLLRELRSEVAANLSWPGAKLAAVFNDDVRGTLVALSAHAGQFGVTLEGIPHEIAKADVALDRMQIPTRVG
jgi:hypothetical protein